MESIDTPIFSSMSNRAQYKRHRAALFHHQKGLCFWCKKPMQLIESDKPIKKVPPDMCTVDHLESRWHPKRGTFGWGTYRHVAACNRCNNERDKAELAAMPKELLRAASQRTAKVPELLRLNGDKLKGVHRRATADFKQRLSANK